jgi:acyl-CoA thioester hydrolase
MAFQAEPYARKVFYYETDRMSIVHHSNYIRWFEESRLDFMRQAGLPYEAIEREGILMPVTDVAAKFLSSSRYGDTVLIQPAMTAFNGVRASFRYEVRLPDGKLLATGTSGHCFLDERTRVPLNLKKRDPASYELLRRLTEPDGAQAGKEEDKR